MAYSEVIKNFERIRSYMRAFYVYGFKRREEYDGKSARSYDNERRRIESYLGEQMAFRTQPNGKVVFLSIDSRAAAHNPLYRAYKAKGFTDGDITLHFILLDILWRPGICRSIQEIGDEVDRVLGHFQSPMLLDESTLRKKLKEYRDLGLLQESRQGKRLLYQRSPDLDLAPWRDALAFYSEQAPLGVVGSYLLDQAGAGEDLFSFKHHDITPALDSEVLYKVLEAIGERCWVTLHQSSPDRKEQRTWVVLPLKVYASVQSGRRYLMGYCRELRRITSYRLDYLTHVQRGEAAEDFDLYEKRLQQMQPHLWGVSCSKRLSQTEHVAFTLRIEEGEAYIAQRLEREKRCGRVEQLDEHTWQFSADVYDTWEMVPWIRTFLGRIVRLNFSNRSVENQFKQDVQAMCQLYGVGGERP